MGAAVPGSAHGACKTVVLMRISTSPIAGHAPKGENRVFGSIEAFQASQRARRQQLVNSYLQKQVPSALQPDVVAACAKEFADLGVVVTMLKESIRVCTTRLGWAMCVERDPDRKHATMRAIGAAHRALREVVEYSQRSLPLPAYACTTSTKVLKEYGIQ